MEYVYAALLLHKLQKDINEDNLKAVVSASGADVNEAQVALADVDIDEAVKAAPVAVAAAAAPAVEEAAPEEPKEEEKKKDEGKDEEAAMEGLSSLFG